MKADKHKTNINFVSNNNININFNGDDPKVSLFLLILIIILIVIIIGIVLSVLPCDPELLTNFVRWIISMAIGC